MEVIGIIIACLIFFAGKGFYDKKNYEKKLRARIIREYGSRITKEIDEARAQSMVYFCSKANRSNCYIDDITWNDLDMDRIYFLLNSCKSAIGEEYLYYLLKNPISDEGQLNSRNRLIKALQANKDLRTELGIFLGRIGSIKKISVYEYISRLNNVEPENNVKHILQALLLAGSIGYIFVNPAIGIVAAVIMFFVNVITYFKRKSQIECYFTIFAYIMGMARTVKKCDALRKADTEGTLKEYTDAIGEAARELQRITRGADFFINPMGSGDILQSFLDYLRMAFHVDLIKFNNIIDKFAANKSVFDSLYSSIGFLDCMLAVASYREWEKDTCEPILTGNEENISIRAFNISHPLIEEPVCNSIETEKSILLTGSNASGKSTFLKTIAINAILAQSIFTVRAVSYSASYFRVMSSIALRDDLESGESYYIVEIKSLKRILDAIKDESKVPVLCFIDEVLRGTNTIERIAASTEILKSLAKSRGICFAATHDIELTYILENNYRNFHFEERVENDEVLFDYLLHEGRATSRNAIRLLGMMGYDREIVEAAAKRADDAAAAKIYEGLQ